MVREPRVKYTDMRLSLHSRATVDIRHRLHSQNNSWLDPPRLFVAQHLYGFYNSRADIDYERLSCPSGKKKESKPRRLIEVVARTSQQNSLLMRSPANISS
ncbi:hypothetical protein J6590_022549 [Homalodisca vitripennis]|nr:hypothetical protein J6590_022549 [Homalodisca vitripennis]